MSLRLGCDVSQYQGVVDWSILEESLVDYSCVRLGDGNLLDDFFGRNWAGAQATPMPVDLYWYVRSGRSPAAVLAWVRQFASPDQSAGKLFWLDVEDGSNTGAGANFKAWLIEMIALLRADGWRVGIYSNFTASWSHIFGSWWPDPEIPLWIAGYPRGYTIVPLESALAIGATSNVDSVPGVDWSGWQFTSSGRAPGVAGNLDLSVSSDEVLADLYPDHFGALPGGATKGGILMALTDDEQKELLAGVRALHPRGIIPRADAIDPTKWALPGLAPEGPPVAELWALLNRADTMLRDRSVGGIARRGDVGTEVPGQAPGVETIPDELLIAELTRRLSAPS